MIAFPGSGIMIEISFKEEIDNMRPTEEGINYIWYNELGNNIGILTRSEHMYLVLNNVRFLHYLDRL